MTVVDKPRHENNDERNAHARLRPRRNGKTNNSPETSDSPGVRRPSSVRSLYIVRGYTGRGIRFDGVNRREFNWFRDVIKVVRSCSGHVLLGLERERRRNLGAIILDCSFAWIIEFFFGRGGRRLLLAQDEKNWFRE